METTTPTKIDLWLAAAIKMEGANPAHNNPINIKYVVGTWEQKLAVGESDGFCVFKDEPTGLAIAKEFFTNCVTGKSSRYPVWLTLYEFYAGVVGDGVRGVKGEEYGGFAPESDDNLPNHYAEVMAEAIGVDPTVEISTLAV